MHRRASVGFWAAVIFQLFIVTSFMVAKEITVRVGQTIVLATAPVDPRDLFRGDYVVLRYEISRIDRCFFSRGDSVYLSVHEVGGVWRVNGTPQDRYEDASRSGAVVLKGNVASANRGLCEVTYGIESYFVPEGQGRDIERLRSGLRVQVVVDGLGNAQIKALLPSSPPVQ
jgi:uncharacterized membrane-anchored protein